MELINKIWNRIIFSISLIYTIVIAAVIVALVIPLFILYLFMNKEYKDKL